MLNIFPLSIEKDYILSIIKIRLGQTSHAMRIIMRKSSNTIFYYNKMDNIMTIHNIIILVLLLYVSTDILSSVNGFSDIGFVFRIGASVKMEHHFQAALDPRKQELLEARFIGARVSFISLITLHVHAI